MNQTTHPKEDYITPETACIEIAPLESIVQNISNPGGNVPPVNPYEQ